MTFRVFFTILLLLVLTGTSFAGIDPKGSSSSVIALYQFETFVTDDFTEYTENGGFHELHGYYIGNSEFGEWLSEDGKDGKCLVLMEKDKITAYAEIPPRIIFDPDSWSWFSEFSIVAWVKLEKQAPNTSLYFSFSGIGFGVGPYSQIILVVDPTGNIGMIYHRSPERGVFGVVFYTFKSENQNVADNEWHHIALSRYRGTNALFIDGEIVAKEYLPSLARFEGVFTSINISTTTDVSFTGEVYVDEVGFFRTGFNPYEMQGLYENGLTKFLETVSVNSQGRLATTWGELKSN